MDEFNLRDCLLRVHSFQEFALTIHRNIIRKLGVFFFFLSTYLLYVEYSFFVKIFPVKNFYIQLISKKKLLENS